MTQTQQTEQNLKRRPGMIAVPNNPNQQETAVYLDSFDELALAVNTGILDPDKFTIEFAAMSNHPLAFKESK
jgi:hypothetical protein